MKVRGQVQPQSLLRLQIFTHDRFSKADGDLRGGSEDRLTSKETIILLSGKRHVLKEQHSFSEEIILDRSTFSSKTTNHSLFPAPQMCLDVFIWSFFQKFLSVYEQTDLFIT